MTSKMLIKHSFSGLVDPANTGGCVHVLRRSKRPDWRKVIENAGWACVSFLGQRRLCSHVTKNDVKWSDNALTKPVIQACPLWTEKYRCPINRDNSSLCIRQSVFTKTILWSLKRKRQFLQNQLILRLTGIWFGIFLIALRHKLLSIWRMWDSPLVFYYSHYERHITKCRVWCMAAGFRDYRSESRSIDALYTVIDWTISSEVQLELLMVYVLCCPLLCC